jgi:PRD1 phage membrane DNA delivery
MNDLTRDITAILMAVVGVAVLATLVSQKNQTGSVITAASKGFANILGVAMGGAASAALA